MTGGSTSDPVRRVVLRNQGQIRFCYERELAQDPDLHGTLTIAFVVSPTGSVSASSVERTTAGDAVASCAASAARRWAYPAPTDGAEVRARVTYRLTYPG